MSILTFIIGLIIGFIVTIVIEFSLVWLFVIRDDQSDDMKSSYNETKDFK